jgi:hypothetical protein
MSLLSSSFPGPIENCRFIDPDVPFASTIDIKDTHYILRSDAFPLLFSLASSGAAVHSPIRTTSDAAVYFETL